MRVSRLYVDRPLVEDAEYRLTGERAHYLGSVLRLRVGSSLMLFNGRGGEFEATVQATRADTIYVRTVQHRTIERESSLAIRLAQSICRGERMDWVIQKAVELGITRIDPLVTERTVVRLNARRAAHRVDHWRTIAIHTCEQCGRNRIPIVSPINELADWLIERPREELKLVLDQRTPNGLDSIDYAGDTVTMLVGPEGGFTMQERALVKTAGFATLALGFRTLRTETAAIVGLAAIQLVLGDLAGERSLRD